MRGLSTIISAVFLVLVATMVGFIASDWLSELSTRQSKNIQTSVQQQIECQFASMYIRNVSYNCSSNCASGVQHTMNITLVNSGQKSLNVQKVYMVNKTGSNFEFDLGLQNLSAGSVKNFVHTSTQSCHGINNSIDKVVVNSLECPADATGSIPGSHIKFFC